MIAKLLQNTASVSLVSCSCDARLRCDDRLFTKLAVAEYKVRRLFRTQPRLVRPSNMRS